jgi:AraC-like DNA-binding protein
MSRMDVISIEGRSGRSSVPEWTDALSTRVGQLPLSSWDQERTHCLPVGQQDFNGCIELGILRDIVLAKVTTSTPHHLTFSLRSTPARAPLVLMFQMSGSCQVKQQASSCTLREDDWCVVDTGSPFHISSLSIHNENLSLRLERPSDPEVLALFARGIGHRWRSTTGVSRILAATVRETFNQMNCLAHVRDPGLERGIAGMAWHALREQVEAPPRLGHDDVQRARNKTFIESRLDDPKLSVDAIAHACGMSVRSVHRAFEAEPGGSVSNYVWIRRLSHCAAELRNPGQAHRPITEVCFTWGFNSSSHFSRLFKERFGVTSREYRQVSEPFGETTASASL